jgi:hypothetical protein
MFKKIGNRINDIGRRITGLGSSSEISKRELKYSDLQKLVISNIEKIELLQEEIEALNQAFESFYKKIRTLIVLNLFLFLLALFLISFIFFKK